MIKLVKCVQVSKKRRVRTLTRMYVYAYTHVRVCAFMCMSISIIDVRIFLHWHFQSEIARGWMGQGCIYVIASRYQIYNMGGVGIHWSLYWKVFFSLCFSPRRRKNFFIHSIMQIDADVKRLFYRVPFIGLTRLGECILHICFTK